MNLLDYKKKVFKDRLEGYLNIPFELKNKITKLLLQDETTYLNLEKVKSEQIEEVHLILNELELFERENRKRKHIFLLEKLAEQFEEDTIDINELTDFIFFGDKLSNIEKRHLLKEKHHRNEFNTNLVVKINKILEDDDNGLNKVKRKWISLQKRKCIKCKNNTGVYKCHACKRHFHGNCLKFKINISKKKVCTECINKE
jgi:hypothetical protein